MAFFNRKDELAALEERLASDRGEYFVLYGRRRVGKSQLLLHFGERCRQLYFEATSGSRQDQLEDITAELARFTGTPVYAEQTLGSWRGASSPPSPRCSRTRPDDDRPRRVPVHRPSGARDRLAAEPLRAEHEDNPDLLLCISGSDVSFFESTVVGYGATTYGRRTGLAEAAPFRWPEIGAFAPGWALEDRIRAWAVFGGVPYYLKEIDPDPTLAEAILRAVLYPDGLLREEPRFLLSQESRLRDTDTYMSCLRAIAGGATRLNEIAQRIGRPAPRKRGPSWRRWRR